jgi:hypothetical protein
MIKCPYCNKKFHEENHEEIELFKKFNKKYKGFANIDYRLSSNPPTLFTDEIIPEINYYDYEKTEDFIKACEEYIKKIINKK